MSVEIVMPRLSDTMDSGTVAQWNKRVGDQVQRGEVLLQIETDKANMDLESYAEGILARIMVNEGESAPVGAPIGVVAENEDELRRLQDGASGEPAPPPPEQTAIPASETDQPPPAQSSASAPQVTEAPAQRVKASPLARRMAEERGLDLATIAGTGPGGRITREDVEAYLQQTQNAPQEAERAPAQAQETAPERPQAPTSTPTAAAEPPPAPSGQDEIVKMSRMQQAVARRLADSKFSAPHFYVTAEIDMTQAGALLKEIKASDPGSRVGYNDLIMKACGLALRKFPRVNSGFRDGQIVHFARVNIGNAVALQGGLITPIVQDVDQKSLGTISATAKDLIARAREGNLQPAEYEGATFTISNLGMYGVDQFTAIINPPGSAILAVGAVTPKPVVVDGEIVVRDRMRVTLSVDHRVIYGAEAAEFLAEVRRLLERPMLILL